MGKVKLTTEEYNRYIERIERLSSRVASLDAEIERQDLQREKIIQLIDDVADEKMSSEHKWDDPTFIDIKDVAKIIGLDWDDYLTNWRAEHNKRLEMLKDEK